ncbi:MAG: hypothetical protein ISS19_16385 [Bacteroidales bacterium]|nr:hypothetical protein [Bacteroidales bacterium]
MIDEGTRKAIAVLVSRKAGLNFPASSWGDLERGIRNACEELRIKNTGLFIQRLLEREPDANLLEVLINHLTIGETYFYREKPVLDVFTEKLLPDLIKQHGQEDKMLNIWSAGCCSGEEPYTIAIILKEVIQDISDWKIRILATDINKVFLDKAIKGKYSAWSFRETPVNIRKKYFTSEGNSFLIHPEIRRMVNFIHLNLIDGNVSMHGIYPEQINVIFCRNVMMYFTPESIGKTYNLFYNVLNPGGWLVTSPVEVPTEAPAPFSLIRLEQMTLLRKTTAPQRADTEFAIPILKEDQKPAIFKVHKPVRKTIHEEIRDTSTRAKMQKLCPNDPVSLARQAFQRKSYDEVIRLLGNTVSSDTSPDILSLLIKAHANLGKIIEAKNLCIKLLEQNTNNPFFYYLEASILLELQEDRPAEKALRKALYLDPEMILSHFLMGNLMRRKGQLKLAYKHYRNILKIIRDLPDDTDLPESDGITAGYIRETVQSLLQ